jgi:transcription elongation factor GreA
MYRVDGPTLLRSTGLLPDGPVLWGRPVPASGPGVYILELPGPLPAAPIDLARVGKWIERVPDLRLDGERPTSKELSARLARYWLPDQVVLYIGSSPGSVGGRVRALEQTAAGDRRPYAGGQWLQVLRGLETIRVWWASTDAAEEYEDALLDAFVDAATDGSSPSGEPPLPFGVLRRPTGERRAHGIAGATLPDTAAPAPPTHVTELAPAPEPEAPRATGGRTRPAPSRASAPRPTPPAKRARPSAGRARPVQASPAAGATEAPRPDAVEVSAEGLERLQAELDDLVQVRRPAIVRRVAAARELGDLRENAEYHAAREELGFLDGRAHALEDRLRRAVVVEAPSGAHAGLGSTLLVEVEGREEELRLVGSSEADPRAGRISTSSPVGRALVGHKAGDEIVVGTPSGAEIAYRVLEVR